MPKKIKEIEAPGEVIETQVEAPISEVHVDFHREDLNQLRNVVNELVKKANR